jgi:Ser-tRNA(Ala) deacylase AlaX
MTRKVFWEDPYQTELNTRIVDVSGSRVLCAETIAFSFSGGQESDRGEIQGYPIEHSEIVGFDIYYTLPTHHTLHVGQPVCMRIDWPRRFSLMRLHFAAELILEWMTQHVGLEKIGAHIAEHKARIDFICDHNISIYFDELLKKYHEMIEKDLWIEKGFEDEATERRYWKIDGFSKVPCGGTHVNSTKEVGPVSLKRVNIGKGKERIEIKRVGD